MAAQEAAKSSGTTDGAGVNAETDEASDALLKEKEAEIRRLREQLLQSKASQGLDSLSAQDKERRKKSKTRRETWCGPAARKSMRMSLAPLPPHLIVRIPNIRL